MGIAFAPREWSSLHQDARAHVHLSSERYGKGGDNLKLKDWSGTMLPALKHHFKMA
jgi:hypothetical protein